jgi:uncharacterized Ntn-hydrolase superfamily protein
LFLSFSVSNILVILSFSKTENFYSMKSILSFFFVSILFIQNNSAQNFYGSEPLAHTYSIVAYDSITGDMGVAVQSHWFSVGPLVAWGEAGVGVVATQSFVNPEFGPKGLELLKNGLSPQEALDSLLGEDEGRAVRQVAILNNKGEAAVHTGGKCIQSAGHILGANYSVQANLMKNDKVWRAMSIAFEKSHQLPLAERMVAALDAAQGVGGDIRGKQSAALLVVRAKPTGHVWKDNLVDLRIEDHKSPVRELKRLLKVHRAYEHMNMGDLAIENGEIEKAMKEYNAAREMFPENEEMTFWTAVTLANVDKLEDALPLFKEVFAKNKNWRTLTPRLIDNELLTVSEKDLERILSQ